MRIIAQPAFDSRNPYTRNLYRYLQRLEGVRIDEFSMDKLIFGSYDVWHRHWPERSLNQKSLGLVLLKLFAAILCTWVAKFKGIKIIWTIHNLHSHEQYYPELERHFWSFFLDNLDGYICLSHRSKQLAIQRFETLKQLPGEVVYHPHYQENYLNQVNQAEAREQLGCTSAQTVLLLLGQLRAYKNIPSFIETFKQLPDPQLVLCVAGMPANAKVATEIQAAAQSDTRVKLHFGYIPDERVEYFMNAANLIVAPYQEILNSGAILLALSFHRPFVSPALGSVTEIAEIVGPSWAFTYETEFNTELLSQAIAWSKQERASSLPVLTRFSPENIARDTLNAYQNIIQSRHTRSSPARIELEETISQR